MYQICDWTKFLEIQIEKEFKINFMNSHEIVQGCTEVDDFTKGPTRLDQFMRLW